MDKVKGLSENKKYATAYFKLKKQYSEFRLKRNSQLDSIFQFIIRSDAKYNGIYADFKEFLTSISTNKGGV